MGDDFIPCTFFARLFSVFLSLLFYYWFNFCPFSFLTDFMLLMAVTSSYCVDLLNLNEDQTKLKTKEKFRMKIHLIFHGDYFLCLIMIFKAINDKFIVYPIMEVAGYTFGTTLVYLFRNFIKHQISKNILFNGYLF